MLASLLLVFALVYASAFQIGGTLDRGLEADIPAFTLGSCAWQAGRPGLCDPVNLVFPGRTWQEVRDALQTQGWTTSGYGSRQSLDTGESGTVQEDEQLFLMDGEQGRYHIRLWQAGFVTFASVHHETSDLTLLSDRLDRDWEVSEAFVADALCPSARACTQTGELPEQVALQGTGGRWRGWQNDARARVIVLP